MPSDPFGTAALRRAVLDAWSASPARLREDANAEEDLVRGGYRDRWFVELAQNAADAGVRAGAPTTLSVRTEGADLVVGNTGAPLDAAGVASLASLRASSKRGPDEAVGRFGVGFAAVLDLGDAPRVVTRTSDGVVGVAFDRSRTYDEVLALGGAVAEEARRRGPDGVPALRLVWPADDADLPGEVTTEVRVPLAEPADELLDRARAEARDLLLALPGLGSVEIEGRGRLERHDAGDGRVTVGGVEWTTLRCGGDLPPELRHDEAGRATLAVEDRGRTRWEGLWAWTPGAGTSDDGAHDVLYAPTPTAEGTTLPARLVVTVPLDADRRRVRPGRLTTHVLRAAAAHLPELVAALAPEHRTLFVPGHHLPASEVDAVLQEAATDALRRAAWLPAADGPDLVPGRASALDRPGPALVAALAGAVEGLTTVGYTPGLGALGVTRLGPADLADRLAGLRRPPSWWHALYAALAIDDGIDRAELAALPVPLVDGRLVAGPRRTLLPGPDLADLDLGGLTELRVVDPAAAHPLLEALGARRADAAALLDSPELRGAVERSVDDAEAGLDVAPLARLVLALGGAGGGALALPDDDGGHRRADELVLPDGALRTVLGDDAPVGVLDAATADAHPRAALLATGVLDGFALVHDEAPTGPDHDLHDEESWWDAEVDPPTGLGEEPAAPPPPLTAVRDLDLVAPDRWEAAWRLLAGERAVRCALVALPGEPPPYTAWWLARHGRLAGRRPGHWRLPGAPDPATTGGLYDPVPDDAAAGLDAGFLATVGVRADLAVADPADAVDLLARLADPARVVAPGAVLAAHTALADALAAGRVAVADVEPPARVRSAAGTVVAADPDRGPAPAVLDRPWLLAAVDPATLVPVASSRAAVLADLLDLPLASERVHGEVRSPGTTTPWAALADAATWAAAAGRELPGGGVVVHERLRVAVAADGGTREVFPGVWVQDDAVHTDDPVRALLAAWTP